MERNMKAALNEVNFVSITANIWTANNRSYMGVTLHWISFEYQCTVSTSNLGREGCLFCGQGLSKSMLVIVFHQG